MTLDIINRQVSTNFNNYIVDGIVITEKLSSELDNAIVTLKGLSTKDDFKIYDVVRLSFDANDTLYRDFVVASYTYDYLTLGTNPKYQVRLELASLTKLLEGVVLPNRAFTNTLADKKIGDILEQECSNFSSLYSSHFKISDTNHNLSVNVSTALANTLVPELTFSKPTMREFFDTFMSMNGSISKLKLGANMDEYVIEEFNLNERQGAMPLNNITQLGGGLTADNYVSDLVGDVENAIGQNSITERVRFQSNDLVFGTDNCLLKTKYPIYDVEKVVIKNFSFYNIGEIKINGTSYASNGTYNVDELDITEFIKPLDVFNALDSENRESYKDYLLQSASKYGIYKNNCMYFERGKNTIDGLNKFVTREHYLGSTFSATAIDSAVLCALSNTYRKPSATTIYNTNMFVASQGDTDGYAGQYNSVFFEITYKPYFNFKYDYKKQSYNQFDLTHQANENTNIGLFGKQASEKLSMLGNDMLSFTARYTGKSFIDGFNLYKIGMTYDGYVITSLERTIYKNEIVFKGVLSKNFTNETAYALLDRQKRYYTLATYEYVNRHEISNQAHAIAVSDTPRAVNPIFTKICKYAILHNKHYVSEYTTDRNVNYVSPLIASISGRSFSYSTEYADASNFGTFRKGTWINNYEQNTPFKYVSLTGEAYDFKMKLYDDFVATTTSEQQTLVSSYPEIAASNFNALVDDVDFYINKDARERILLTTSYYLTNATDYIKVGNNAANIMYAIMFPSNYSLYYLVGTTKTPINSNWKETGIKVNLVGTLKVGIKKNDNTMDEILFEVSNYNGKYVFIE